MAKKKPTKGAFGKPKHDRNLTVNQLLKLMVGTFLKDLADHTDDEITKLLEQKGVEAAGMSREQMTDMLATMYSITAKNAIVAELAKQKGNVNILSEHGESGEQSPAPAEENAGTANG